MTDFTQNNLEPQPGPDAGRVPTLVLDVCPATQFPCEYTACTSLRCEALSEEHIERGAE